MSAKFETKQIWASSPVTVRGDNAFISGDPKGKRFLYCNTNSIYIRDIENPSVCEVYIEHSYPTTCAKFAPSGFYVASGDNRGNLKIWDPNRLQETQKPWKEYQPSVGSIRDISWTEDSKRLVLSGEGGSYGAAIAADTGTTVGRITHISKNSHCCDVRQARPYKAIFGSDDFKVYFYDGVPFKYNTVVARHKQFVTCTKFSPNGDLFLTAATDGMCFLYDGKTAEYKLTLGGDKTHKGGIYGAQWSSGGRQILTASADKTAKIWDAERGVVVTEFSLGNSTEDQQLACLWQNDYLRTVSLGGDITYLDPSNPAKPIRVLKGHQKAIRSLTLNTDKTKVISGSFDGVTNCWDVGTGCAESVEGNRPKLLNQIDQREGKVSTIGHDDTLRTIDLSTMQYEENVCSLDAQPQAVVRGAGGLSVAVGTKKITLAREAQKAAVLDVDYEALAVDIHPNMSEVAVGSKDGKIYVYDLSGDTLSQKTTLSMPGDVNRCRYSPDGRYLAAGGTQKNVEIFEVQEDFKPNNRTQYKHAARVTDIAWSANSAHYASVSLDGSVMVWSIDKEAPLVTQKGVHGRNEVSSIQWLNENTVVTAGTDACLRVSTVQL